MRQQRYGRSSKAIRRILKVSSQGLLTERIIEIGLGLERKRGDSLRYRLDI